MITPPERKPTISLVENFENRMMFNVMNVGDYVKIKADTSPNKNCPSGNGFPANGVIKRCHFDTLVSQVHNFFNSCARTVNPYIIRKLRYRSIHW